MRDQRAKTDIRLDGLDAAARFFGTQVAVSDPSVENLWVAHLDDRSACLQLTRQTGEYDAADVPIRTILLDAARLGSSGLLLAHTHPSGDPSPSESDCRLTRRLASLADAIGCRLVDHLIFAGPGFTSFRKAGLL